MGFFLKDSNSSPFTSSSSLTDLLHFSALLLPLMRWAFIWALKFRTRNSQWAHSSPSDHVDEDDNDIPDRRRVDLLCSGPPSSTVGFISGSVQEGPDHDTCAVCLNQLRDGDEVRELENCCHVFHSECISRWTDHDDHENHKACPLCRIPLESRVGPMSQPSWAVERLLYLFGDDLLI